MKNIIDLKPRGSVSLANGEKASAGEASFVKNLREQDGVLVAVGGCVNIGDLAYGERIVYADESEWGMRLLSVADGKLMWYGTVDGDGVERCGVKLADITGGVVSVKGCGNYVVASTGGGVVVLRRRKDGYELYDAGEVRPLVMFSASEASVISERVPAYTFAHAYSSWNALDAEDKDGIARQWLDAMRAMKSAARLDGRYCGIVAVRCGVRLFDDSYLWFGAPSLVGVEQASKVLDWAEREVTAGSSGLTGVNASVAMMPTYRLGVTAVSGIPDKWRGVVKAVDVFVSDEIMLADFDAGSVECRCTTTTTGGSRRQSLLISPCAADSASVVSKAVNVGRWHVVSSTTDLQSLRQGRWEAVGCETSKQRYVENCTTMALHTATQGIVVKDTVCADTMRMAGMVMQFGDMAAGCGKVYGGNVHLLHSMPWSVAQYFSGEMSPVACVAAFEVTIHTDDGVKKISGWENLPFTPTEINALVSFPDVRASHFRLWLQGDADVMMCEGDFCPNGDATQAVAVSAALAAHTPLPTGEEFITLPEVVQWEESISGGVAIAANGNPFSWWLARCVEGVDIKAIAVSVRPLYGGGFGRYPLFLFCGDGIYAVKQLADGELDDARLISRELLLPGSRPCETGDAIMFLNRRGRVMQLSGATIVDILRNADYRSLAWNNVRQELWMVNEDGVVDVLMPSGRIYRRDEKSTWVYSSSISAFAGCEGKLLDITKERDKERIDVAWLSQPVLLDDAMSASLRKAVWSVFSDSATLRLCVYGERGLSCYGFLLSALRTDGVLGAPIVHRIVAPHLRSVRAELSGRLHAGDVISGVSFRMV